MLKVNAKADVWSLGGILAFIINYENPWQGWTDARIMEENGTGNLPPIRLNENAERICQGNEWVLGRLQGLLDGCLHRTVQERMTVEGVLKELGDLLERLG